MRSKRFRRYSVSSRKFGTYLGTSNARLRASVCSGVPEASTIGQ